MNFPRFAVLSHHVISKAASKCSFKRMFHAANPKYQISLLCWDGKYVSTNGLLKEPRLYALGGIVRAEHKTHSIVPKVATQYSLCGRII